MMMMYKLCIVVTTGFSFFAECQAHSAKAVIHSANALPSVRSLGKASDGKEGFRALGKEELCRVPVLWHSAKPKALGKLAFSGSASTLYSHEFLSRLERGNVHTGGRLNEMINLRNLNLFFN